MNCFGLTIISMSPRWLKHYSFAQASTQDLHPLLLLIAGRGGQALVKILTQSASHTSIAVSRPLAPPRPAHQSCKVLLGPLCLWWIVPDVSMPGLVHPSTTLCSHQLCMATWANVRGMRGDHTQGVHCKTDAPLAGKRLPVPLGTAPLLLLLLPCPTKCLKGCIFLFYAERPCSN